MLSCASFLIPAIYKSKTYKSINASEDRGFLLDV